MSELAKIAAILFKNLSDALLSTASEISKLNPPASPLSQANENPELVSISRTMPHKRFSYQPRDKVIVKFSHMNSSLKMRVLKKLSDTEYLVYEQGGLKADARKATVEMILGLDPDP